MKRDFLIGLLLILGVAGLLSGCGKNTGEQVTVKRHSEESQESRTEEAPLRIQMLQPILHHCWHRKFMMEGTPFDCSTLSVENQDGGYLFGRNFAWNACNGLIVSARSENSYASVSTVNMDFIRAGGIDISKLPDSVRAIVSLYAPLDGMNEKGLAVSVNMIQDSVSINQDTAKPDLTTTTAVRLLLDKAANVEEALELLRQYDFNSSMGMMVHLALADADGRNAARRAH